MGQSAKLLQPNFSVADAEYPSLHLQAGILLVEFRDWQERNVRVRFSNAAGVKWQELDVAGPDVRDDSVYEILGSLWLDDYVLTGARTSAERARNRPSC
jgi:hypothetical protein